LRTDASDIGLGAVLLQHKGDMKLPIVDKRNVLRCCRERVWGIQKFQRYLYGTEFILETDHRPLTYLGKSKTNNARLMRRAL